MSSTPIQEKTVKSSDKAVKKVARSTTNKASKTKFSSETTSEEKLGSASTSKTKIPAKKAKAKSSATKTSKPKSSAAKSKRIKTNKTKDSKGKSITAQTKVKISNTNADRTQALDIDKENQLDQTINPIDSSTESNAEEILMTSAAMSDEEIRAKALASIKIGPKGVYTEDSIRVYLQEIGRIRLLRPDEEIELARKIADLLHLEEDAIQFESENGHYPTTKEWAVQQGMPVVKFRRRLMLGRRAKEKMVQSNLRLVVSIAKKYMNRGLSFQDLIQEGSLGLIRAAEKFDHEKGYKFSTYATW